MRASLNAWIDPGVILVAVSNKMNFAEVSRIILY